MKYLLTLLALCALLPAPCALAQTKGVLKNITGNTITEDLTFPSGRTLTIAAGATINATGATITGFGSGGGASALDDLTDVTITTAATGQILRYNGTAWVNYTHGFLTSSDLSGYLTSATAASTYAPLASPTFTGTVTIPSGASITGYATTAAVAAGYAPLAHNQAWSTITDTPTTLAGYGISDGQTTLAALTEDVMNGTTRISHSTTFATSSGPGLISLEEAPEQEADFLGLRAPNSLTSTITYVLPQAPTTSGHVLTTGAAAGGEAVTAWQAIVAPAGTLTGTTLASNVVTSSLTSLGTISTGVWQGSIIGPAYLGTGSSITSKYLRGDGTWQTISGGGDALTTGTLDQFADVTQTATKTLAITESTTLAGGTHSGANTGDQTTITGNAGTATALETARTINGTSFDGTANITVTAAAGTLTGTTLASNVVTSSLTALGTIATGVWQGTAIADSYISSAATWNAKESALTFSTGLTRSTNTITVNTSQNIATLSNLTSNGFVKTSGGTGSLSIDTTTYLATTGNGSSLTGLTQSQISGLTTTDRAQFANVRVTHSTLTYAATTDIDMDGNGFQTVTLTGNITFTTSNRAAGRSKTIRIVGDSSLRTLTWPAGWTWIGAAAPASLAANKDAILTITAFGTADSDIVAAYSAEP